MLQVLYILTINCHLHLMTLVLQYPHIAGVGKKCYMACTYIHVLWSNMYPLLGQMLRVIL